VRLISWNIQWCRGVDGSVDPARIARSARALADPDVCCFQEVAAGCAALAGSSGEDQAELLAREFSGYRALYAWGVDVPGAGDGRSRFGNLVLSRLPVQRVLRHSLPWPADPGTPSMPRVALEAVIEAPWGPVRVITTHLEYYSAAQRAAQVERLRELHAEAYAHSRAAPPRAYNAGPFEPLARPAGAILCGDFNFPPQDALHARLQAPFACGAPRLLDAWQLVHPGAPHPPTFRLYERNAPETPYCCDFVFVSKELAPRVCAVRVDAETQASDHQPVIVEFR
jgi:endonuclease/exonuclease/phosphatase family metal-dependent hydrolase